MAKKSVIERNKKRKKLVEKYSGKRAEYKAVVLNRSLSMQERFTAQQELDRLPRDSSKTRVANRCEITGRKRAYYRKFKVSRIMLRLLASEGLLPGVKKASW